MSNAPPNYSDLDLAISLSTFSADQGALYTYLQTYVVKLTLEQRMEHYGLTKHVAALPRYVPMACIEHEVGGDVMSSLALFVQLGWLDIVPIGSLPHRSVVVTIANEQRTCGLYRVRSVLWNQLTA